MSYALKEIVKRTEIKPMAAKCLLLHVADMVRDNGAWEFWESHGTTARHLGTDRKTVRRQFSQLDHLGVLFAQGEREVAGGYVNVFMIDVSALLSLPCVDETESRQEFVKRLIEGENYCHEANWPDQTGTKSPSDVSGQGGAHDPHPRGSEPHPPGFTTPTPGAQSPINGNKPNLTLINGKRAREHQSFSEALAQIQEQMTSKQSQGREPGRS